MKTFIPSQKKYTQIKWLMLSLLAIPATGFANCPAPQAIIQSNSHYNMWQAPWFEGFGSGIEEKAYAVTFVRAEWQKYKDTFLGNALVSCYYKVASAKTHQIIMSADLMLGQNNYDVHIDNPKDSHWQKIGADKFVCTDPVSDCHFNYPG